MGKRQDHDGSMPLFGEGGETEGVRRETGGPIGETGGPADETPESVPPREPEIPYLAGLWHDNDGMCTESCPAAVTIEPGSRMPRSPDPDDPRRWVDCKVLDMRMTAEVAACPVRALYEALRKGPTA
jgi:ferredoxin